MFNNRFILMVLLSLITIFSSNCKDKQTDKLSAFTKSLNYEKDRKYDLALSEMEKVKNDLANDYFTNLRLGWLYYNNKNYQESIKYYNQAFALSNNKSVEALLGLTYPLDALSKTDEIITTYKKVLDIDNNNYTANLKLAIIYYYKANYQSAKLFLDKIYPLYSSDYYINLYYGWTLYKLNSKSKAKEFFVNALINNPNDASAKEGLEACR